MLLACRERISFLVFETLAMHTLTELPNRKEQYSEIKILLVMQTSSDRIIPLQQLDADTAS